MFAQPPLTSDACPPGRFDCRATVAAGISVAPRRARGRGQALRDRREAPGLLLAGMCAALALLAAPAAADEGQRAAEWRNPAMACFEGGVSFYLNFDGGTLGAALADGRAGPSEVDGAPEFRNGKFGDALLVGQGTDFTVSYPLKDNVDFTSPGAISLWLSPVNWQREASLGKRRYFIARGAGRRYIELHRWASMVGRERTRLRDALFLFGYNFPERSNIALRDHGINRYVTKHEGEGGWQDGDWHHVVLNWNDDGIALYTDGVRRQGFDWDRPITEEDFPPDGGHEITFGGDGNDNTLVDEVMVFSRALSDEEIGELFQTTVGMEFALNEPLDAVPEQAVVENARGVTLDRGRLDGTEAVYLRDAALQWNVDADGRYFIEFWVKPVEWDGLADGEQSLSRFTIGAKDFRLYKPDEDSELVLEQGGRKLRSYPIYRWREQDWMSADDERPRWQYVCISVDGSEIELSVNGFGSTAISDVTLDGPLTRFALHGGSGTAFSELRVVKGWLPYEQLRSRYRHLYRGEPVEVLRVSRDALPIDNGTESALNTRPADGDPQAQRRVTPESAPTSGDSLAGLRSAASVGGRQPASGRGIMWADAAVAGPRAALLGGLDALARAALGGESAAQAAQSREDHDEREMTEEERAYARTWSAEELGVELLRMGEWWDNDLGRGDEVPGPWVPMEVEGDAVVTFGHRYEYADSLFPAQIVIDGEPVFAGPAAVVVRAAGGRYVFTDAEVTIDRLNDAEVHVRSVSRQGPLALRLKKVYEFDGMARVDFALEADGDPVEIDAASLRFVLRDDRSRLFHYTAAWSNQYPGSASGAVPAEGIVLDRFRELLWLGGHNRGFCWFADTLEGWRITDETGIQHVMERDDGARELTIKLADRPFVLDEPWELVFGMQATPMRPMIENRRILSDRNERLRWEWTWGDGGPYYPFHRDPGPARQQIREMRAQDREVMPASSQRFYSRYRNHISRFGEIEDPGLTHREVMLWGALWSQSRAAVPELEPLPGRHTATGDWFGESGPRGLIGLCANSPFQDYYLWRLQKTIEDTGLGAIYLDQPLGECMNAHHGCGYIDYNGQWRPSGLIFARREMQKRMYRMFYEAHGFTRIMWHSSNQIIVPVVAFTDIFLDGEEYRSTYGGQLLREFYSDLLSPGEMQAQHTGLPFGFAPTLLPMSPRQHGPTQASVTDVMGYFYVHDSHVRPLTGRMAYPELGSKLNEIWLDFPYAGSRQIHYWDGDPALSVSPKEALYIAHVTETDLMVILFNPADRPMSVELELDAGQLGLGADVDRLRDAESGAGFQRRDGLFRARVAPRDLRILRHR